MKQPYDEEPSTTLQREVLLLKALSLGLKRDEMMTALALISGDWSLETGQFSLNDVRPNAVQTKLLKLQRLNSLSLTVLRGCIH